MRRRFAICATIAGAFAILGAVRVAGTYGAIGGTFDEPLHIAAGTALITRHSYTRDLQTPPLARIAMAIGPHLAGMRSLEGPGLFTEGDSELQTGPGYVRNLELARLGILPFFLAACVLLYAWSRRVAGDVVAATAVGLFAFTPPILAHAGLATTDMAATAAFVGLLLAFSAWLDRPSSMARSIWFGIAGGLALASKFSLIGFFAATALVMLVVRGLDARRAQASGRRSVPPRVPVARLVVATASALIVLFAAYGFLVTREFGIPAPLSEFALGLLFLIRHNIDGNAAYLLGTAYIGGRWAFFPVVLAVKTPIPLLLLSLGGGLLAVRSWRRTHRSAWVDALAAVLMPLAVASASNINLGVRHILPLYPALCLLAAVALAALWRAGWGARAVAVALAAWMVVGTWRAHPDYLAYFNELAARDPGAVLVDSDLDWGQDLERLADTVRARGITELSLVYFGTGTRPAQILPNVHRVHIGDPPARGWLAISETAYRRGMAGMVHNQLTLYPNAFGWLRAYQPVARIGPAMRLYFIPADSTDRSTDRARDAGSASR